MTLRDIISLVTPDRWPYLRHDLSIDVEQANEALQLDYQRFSFVDKDTGYVDCEDMRCETWTLKNWMLTICNRNSLPDND